MKTLIAALLLLGCFTYFLRAGESLSEDENRERALQFCESFISRDLKEQLRWFEMVESNGFDWQPRVEQNNPFKVPPLLVSGVLLSLKEEKYRYYALLQVRHIVGPNDLLTIVADDPLRQHERWVVFPDATRHEGELIVKISRSGGGKAVFAALKDSIGKPLTLMVKPTVNEWLRYVRSVWEDKETPKEEKLEAIKRFRKRTYSALASFDPRIPVAEAEYTDLLKYKGADFNTNFLRRQWERLGIEVYDDSLFFERIEKMKDWTGLDAAALFEESHFAVWKVEFAVALNLAEHKMKDGLARLIDFAKFEVELEKIDMEQARVFKEPVLPSATPLLLYALEKTTGQKCESLQAYVQWYEKAKDKLDWKSLPPLPKRSLDADGEAERAEIFARMEQEEEQKKKQEQEQEQEKKKEQEQKQEQKQENKQ